MKFTKNIFIIIIFAIIFLTLFYFTLPFFNKINQNYILLENGERGYVMNTQNIIISIIFSIGFSLLLIKIFMKYFFQKILAINL